MPITPFTPAPRTIGNWRVMPSPVALDASYPTGGYPISAAMFGLTQILAVFVRATPEFTASRLFRWNRASNTLQVYTAVGTEAAGSSDQSTIIAAITIIGR